MQSDKDVSPFTRAALGIKRPFRAFYSERSPGTWRHVHVDLHFRRVLLISTPAEPDAPRARHYLVLLYLSCWLSARIRTVSGRISTNIPRKAAIVAPLEIGWPPLSNGVKIAAFRGIFVEIRPKQFGPERSINKTNTILETTYTVVNTVLGTNDMGKRKRPRSCTSVRPRMAAWVATVTSTWPRHIDWPLAQAKETKTNTNAEFPTFVIILMQTP